MSKAQFIASTYATKTDLSGRLSYDSKISNMSGVLHTNLAIGLVIKNTGEAAVNVYIAPDRLLGMPCDKPSFADTLIKLKLPSGVNALHGSQGTITVTPTDSDHDIDLIASEIGISPIQVKAISITSLSNSGTADTQNTSGVINFFNVSSFRPLKRRKLDLAELQQAGNFHNNILKIDLIGRNLPVAISSADVMSLTVAPGTNVTVTLHIGARDSREERFFRDIEGGTQLILDAFPGEVDCSCNK